MPWQQLCAVIDPHYSKMGRVHPPIVLERMCFMQHNRLALADKTCEEALLDGAALLLRLVGIQTFPTIDACFIGPHRQHHARLGTGFRLIEPFDARASAQLKSCSSHASCCRAPPATH